MAVDYANGTEGRVRVGVGNTVVASLNEWSLEKSVAEIPINTFENTANSDGIVFTNFEPGLGSGTATLSGYYNVDATDKTEGGTPGLRIGVAVVLDLLFTRTPFGYTDLAGFVRDVKAGTKVENSMASFSATVRFTGTIGVAA